MSVSFEKSETKLHLMRAFAGESQARNRYTFAAELAQKKGLYVLEGLFAFTAHQERAHAKVYYDRLAACTGQSIAVDGGYPVDLFPELLQHLRAAQHNEYAESHDIYKSFATCATQEGFAEIATLFTRIGAVEQAHGDRFGKFADLLEQDRLFVAETEVKWICLNCGTVVSAPAAPALCPVCKHPQGYFVRQEFAPYTA